MDPFYSEIADKDLIQRLKLLTPLEKEIVVLKVLEDHTFEEIALLLSEKPATVRKKFERLKKKLIKNKNILEVLIHGQKS